MFKHSMSCKVSTEILLLLITHGMPSALVTGEVNIREEDATAHGIEGPLRFTFIVFITTVLWCCGKVVKLDIIHICRGKMIEANIRMFGEIVRSSVRSSMTRLSQYN